MPCGQPAAPTSIVAQNEILAVDVITNERPNFLDIAIRDNLAVLQYCARWQLIRNCVICALCGNFCSFVAYCQISDGFHWMCQPCSQSYSVCVNLWFCHSHLPIWKILGVCYF